MIMYSRCMSYKLISRAFVPRYTPNGPLKLSGKLGIHLFLLLDPDDLVLLNGVLSVSKVEVDTPQTDRNGGDGQDQGDQQERPRRLVPSSNDQVSRLGEMSDGGAPSDFGNLSGVQDVSKIHVQSLREFVGPNGTGNGGSDGSSNAGPQGQQGDGGTHVSVGYGSLNSHLSTNDGESTLNDRHVRLC